MGWADEIRAPYALVDSWLKSVPADQLALKRREVEVLFRRIGIAFAVYTEGGDAERLVPFAPIPRVLAQALNAFLNAFLHDIYHDRDIIRAGHIPGRLVLQNTGFRAEMAGLDLPGHV